MKLSHLLKDIVSNFENDCDIKGIQNDSRQIKPGDLFLAYPGRDADGRRYIEQAIKAGASAILYEPKGNTAEVLTDSLPFIPVANLAHQSARIAAQFYHHPANQLHIVGVTGTNGKTTIAYQLAQAYNHLNQPSAYIGTLGQGPLNHIEPLSNTTPDALTLQRLLADYHQQNIQYVSMEVSSHALVQQRVAEIPFIQAIFTNLTHEHLDYHHTMENYAAAKAQLFATDTLQSAIINEDDPYASIMKQTLNPACKLVTYGRGEKSIIRAINETITMTGSEFEVMSPWGTYPIQIQTLGLFNLYNSLAVLAALLYQGYSFKDLIPIMPLLKPTPGRMEVVVKEPCIIVDYAHTPDALHNALSTLSVLKKNRLGVVFGCGGGRDRDKRPLMGKIASELADFAIVTSDNPRQENPEQILDDITKGMKPMGHCERIVNRMDAIQKAVSIAEKDDIIIIAGKGHEPYQEIGKERFSFSDQNVVRELMALVQ